MNHQALYRRYRPKTFDDVVEQQHVVTTLKNTVISGKPAHAYLFCGTRGTGKTTMAKILARAVNCLEPEDGNPCNKCEVCTGILSGTILDVIEMDAASNNSVDNVRDIIDEMVYTPSQASYKIYIIDEVHMLSSGAFNALLKTLEEPPEHVLFILATTEPNKLPGIWRAWFKNCIAYSVLSLCALSLKETKQQELYKYYQRG
jgi:DNA polymerase-3 subunit gamma/tau